MLAKSSLIFKTGVGMIGTMVHMDTGVPVGTASKFENLGYQWVPATGQIKNFGTDGYRVRAINAYFLTSFSNILCVIYFDINAIVWQ